MLIAIQENDHSRAHGCVIIFDIWQYALVFCLALRSPAELPLLYLFPWTAIKRNKLQEMITWQFFLWMNSTGATR